MDCSAGPFTTSSRASHQDKSFGFSFPSMFENITMLPPVSFVSTKLIKLLEQVIGLELLSLLFLLYASFQSVTYVWSRLRPYVYQYCISSITAEVDDEIHELIMNWCSTNTSSTTLQVKTRKASDEDVDESERVEEFKAANKGSDFHLIEWQKLSRPIYQPFFGQHYFTFAGRTLWISRKRDSAWSERGSGNRDNHAPEKIDDVTICCWGRSTEPLKQFIQETRKKHFDEQASKTQMYRVRTSSWGARWTVANKRTIRPMETVALDETMKKDLLEDVSEFLHPDTPRSYARKGIPYRRGYLFYGPPGTGKSSLAFALAGHHGLQIHFLSLGDPTMNDEKLMNYFGELPKRCIILIEDIDTVDITHSRKDVDEPNTDGKDADGEKQPAKTRRPGPGRRSQYTGDLTLSGLLNAIDGVAAHEGRILIMTTNHREILDEALTRDGRVDVAIRFELASKEQIVQVFKVMYEKEDSDKVATEKLAAAANAFADMIPAGKLSPAEVQGFLQKNRDYNQALAKAEEWKNKVMAGREGK